VSGGWTSAELFTANSFTFGTFQWQIEALLDTLDPKVVLSLYTYRPLIAGVDGTNQITIDFSRWEQNTSTAPNLFYNVWPASTNETKNGISFLYSQTSPYTTHRIIWSPKLVSFKSLHGFQNGDANLFQSWQSSVAFATAVPQAAAPIHIKLWIFHSATGDLSPTDGNQIEVIIHDFTYANQSVLSTLSAIECDALFVALSILISVSFTIISQIDS